MKIAKVGPKLSTVLAVAFLLVPFLGAPYARGSTQRQTLSRQQARWLIGHAETPVQHQQLAAYYRQQAAHCLREVKEHSEMTWPEGNAAKHGWLGYTPGAHCRYWAGVMTKRARQDEVLAAVHEKMAKEITTNK